MPPESDRQAVYDQLREQFLTDPDFRSRFEADPAGTMESALGPLTDEERQWVSGLGDVSGDDLVERIKGRVGAW